MHMTRCGPLPHSYVAWCVSCQLVIYESEPYKNAWANQDATWGVKTLMDSRNHVLGASSHIQREGHFYDVWLCPDLPEVDILNLIH